LKQKKTDNSVSQWSTPYHDLQWTCSSSECNPFSIP
jgi:hypothetical protein